MRRLRRLRESPALLEAAKSHYRDHPVDFITHWCDTYDPRNAFSGVPTKLPFLLFSRQVQLIQFLHELVQAQANGLVEKTRDMGATWAGVCFSVWLWLFWDGSSVGWGSREQDLVDKIGDPDSIFEKLRMTVRSLPDVFLPPNLTREHMSFMRMINPDNGASITGDVGDNIGRGGRKLVYFKDESAHYQHPELIEASLMDTTRVQVDISSVHGLGNVFHRKREAGQDWEPGETMVHDRVNVFVMDWRDHPAKDQAWHDRRATEFRNNGLSHVFAQEVDRDYAASVEGVIIEAAWVVSAINAHLKIDGLEDGGWAAALDVADEGLDTNALCRRKGRVIRSLTEWGDRDTGVTTRRAVDACRGVGALDLQYDCVGLGAGVKAEANRLRDDKLMPPGITLVPWNAGGEVMDKEKHVVPRDRNSPLNKNLFQNFKAQAWWHVARMFEHTHWAVTGKADFTYDPGDLISIDGNIPLIRKLQKELSQATMVQSSSLKMLVDKAPDGVRSPNLADSVIMCCFPARNMRPLAISDAALAYSARRH